MPKVSVIMSVYNAEQFLREAVQSILDQTYKGFEFIIVQDGSTDGTMDILASFADPRIKIIHQDNIGLTKSLNKAIKISSGEYIARMDADDVSLPKRLEKQVQFLDAHEDVAMCGTQATFLEDEPRSGEIQTQFSVPLSHAAIKKSMLFHNPFIHPSIIMRATVFKKNPYNELYKHMQDYELWTRIVPFHQTANLPDVLLNYRIVTSGITRLKKKTLRYKIGQLYIRLLFVIRYLKSLFPKLRG